MSHGIFFSNFAVFTKDIQMIWLKQQWKRLLNTYHPSRDVALVLSGGGAKGWAHVGAIDSLVGHGYRITSIAGTSMGAVVGGLYAAGKMDELRAIAERMTRKRMLRIFGFSPGFDHITNGERIMLLLDQIIGDINIEDLVIPFCCSATDLVSGDEVVFREGNLKRAIRASISIPMFFKPVCDGNRFFVDGSVRDTLPLNCVARKPHDLLVAVNVSGACERPDTKFLSQCQNVPSGTGDHSKSIFRLRRPEISSNYINVMTRVMQLMIQNDTERAMCLTPPDLYVNVPMDDFGLFDFDKGAELIRYGQRTMDEALQKHG